MTSPPDSDRQKPVQPVTRDPASRIAAARQDRANEARHASGASDAEMSGLARGLRIGSEFVAAILVGTGLGYLIDLGLNTSPWGLLILFMVGFAAGILNVIRAVTEMNAAAPTPPQRASQPSRDADGEARDD